MEAETLKLLRKLLASWVVFYQKTHTYHWNVTGQNFLEVHKLLETHYTKSVEHTDLIAEYLRQQKEFVYLSLKEAVEDSNVSDDNSQTTTSEMLFETNKALLALKLLQTEIYTKEDAKENSDYVLLDLMTDLTKWCDFQVWFINSINSIK